MKEEVPEVDGLKTVCLPTFWRVFMSLWECKP